MNITYKGQDMYNLAVQIFPFCRSITGEGVRRTLLELKEYIGKNNGPCLNIHDIPSGTKVFDWTVPKEWKIRDAYIEDSDGNHIIDMAENNLHVLGYSAPLDKWVGFEELKQYIYTRPEQPEVIPYVTSYYQERSGFCMSENQYNSLMPGNYHLVVDSEFFDGVLNYAELVLPGNTEQEVFFSTYCCHPSMGNDECSGPVVIAELMKTVAKISNRRYTYRFIVIPETIGSISYLSIDHHLQHMKDTMIAGFNLSCVGDERNYSIVESRNANTLADRALKNVLKYYTNGTYSTYSFLKRGSDERQYNAPGVELPVVCFCRSKFCEYPEYHTSADDLDLISPDGLQGSYEVLMNVIETLEYNDYYKTTILCEPQLGRRGLFPTISKKGQYDSVMTMTNFITYADGKKDLIEISDTIGTPVKEMTEIIDRMMKEGIVARGN